MRLLLIRHGIAAPRGGEFRSDNDRPLTPQGEKRFRQVATALGHLVPRPRAVLTSPLLRARQTAELAAGAWGGASVQVVPALATGEERGIRRALAARADEDTVVLVGHEEWMSRFTARLLGSAAGQRFRYRKGGVALVEVDRARPDRGRLLWFIPPRVLRKLR